MKRQYQTLINNFEEAFELIERDKVLITEKKQILFEKISKLFENIICWRIYTFFKSKIMSFINKKVYQNLKSKLKAFIESIENDIWLIITNINFLKIELSINIIKFLKLRI